MTPIDFTLTSKNFKGIVHDPDSEDSILTLCGKPGPGIPGPQLDLVLYSWHNKELLRTQVITRGGGKACLPGGVRARVGSSQHPMAERLRSLGIDNLKPRVVAVPEFFTTPIVENPRLWAASLPTENPALDLLREYATDHNLLVGGSYLERRGHYRRPGVDARRTLTGNARALLDSRARLALPVLLAAAELVWA